MLVLTSDGERRADLAGALTAAGYGVTLAREPASASDYDLVVVDATDERAWAGVELLAGGRLVVLVDGPESMRRAFELGADDCVLSGAHPDEVSARCYAVLRRTDRATTSRDEAAVYVDRRLWINFASRQVWVAGEAVHLTPREFRLLGYLVQHRDRTLQHDELLRAVWARTADSQRPREVLKQYVWRLRQKLEEDPNAPEVIVTEAGEGYRFVAQP